MVDISSTVVTPVGVNYLGNPKTHSHYNNSGEGRDESADTLLEGLPGNRGNQDRDGPESSRSL